MSNTNNCLQCGAFTEPNTSNCLYCGSVLPQPQTIETQNTTQTTQNIPIGHIPISQQPPLYNASWPIKCKTTAGLLGIFLGGLGIHKFYLGKVGIGVLYLLLSWTFIPAIIGFIEGIVYLASNDHNFQIKHKVRLR
ncbi:MAG: NINE protein [Oscillospiraceae bacterium]|nr:NINE protein [Oscillospiraceae bacterium]